jgi:chromosomal replication initiator protein
MTDIILQETAQAFGLRVTDLTGKARYAHIVWARQAAAWVLRQRVPGISIATVGSVLGGRDHTTIMHALNCVPARRASEPLYDQIISRLERPPALEQAA